MQFALAQSFDFEQLDFKGKGFNLEKADILKSFGEGEKKYTQYECGFFSNDQTGAPYYQLIYEGFSFIGSETETFSLEFVHFENHDLILKYGDHELSRKTTKEMFSKIFKVKMSDLEDDVIIVFGAKSDDGVRFRFKHNRLFQFEYWTPC
jgi:hypothetical protein